MYQFLMRRLGELTVLWLLLPILLPASAQDTPNIILIYIDDMGYGDIGPFGCDSYETPHLDQLASDGRRFTDFLVSSAVCSASRAALMTGCYHERVSIQSALGPDASHGISEKETTIAEICKQKNYATACYGKWHLGHHPQFLPTNHGFDEYYGLPYSNDMWPGPVALRMNTPEEKWRFPRLPLIEQLKIIDEDVVDEEQKYLTKNYTQRAVSFIEKHQDEPFFIYLAHSMVHVPLFVSPEFEGKTGKGLFADVVAEVDWSVGMIRKTLADQGIADNTLIIFSSDNGPWLNYGKHAGTAGSLREGKGTSWEGGIRVPTMMAWPGHIPPGTTTDTLCATVDILPTIAQVINAQLPGHTIDGKSIVDVMTGPENVPSLHECIPIYFLNNQLQAVRDDRFKLVLPHTYRTIGKDAKGYGLGRDDGTPVEYGSAKVETPELYDMTTLPDERSNVAASKPDEVRRLMVLADEWRAELGDSLTNHKGQGIRLPGRLAP